MNNYLKTLSRAKQLVICFCFTVILLTIVIVSCKKASENSSNKSEATEDYGSYEQYESKDWFYRSFINSPEWKSYDATKLGNKLPDWRKGKLLKIGKYEITEFPLIKSKTKISVGNNENLSQEDLKRIAEASLKRIVFIKSSDDKIEVREIDYIPDWKYLKQKGFDISGSTLAHEKSDFTGRIITKKWNDEISGIYRMVNGKIKSKGIKKPQISPVANSVNKIQECTSFETCEYEQICVETWHGDYLAEEDCSGWQPTGACWIEEYCDNSECDPYDDTCLCSFYGICNNDVPDEEPCVALNPDDILNASGPVAENASASVSLDSVDNNGIKYRTMYVQWDFYKGDFLTYKWRYRSYDRGGQSKSVNENWKWIPGTIVHESHPLNGFAPPHTTMTMQRTLPQVLDDGAFMKMKLQYTVQICFKCDGQDMGCRSKIAESSKIFNVHGD